MNAQLTDAPIDRDAHGDEHAWDGEPGPAGEIEVRRNGALFAVVGAISVVLAIGYLVRGIGDGGLFAWLAFLVTAGIGTALMVSWLEARTPLLVADDFGIRIRLGREWRGLPWSSLEQVVVEQRTSVLHDGRLVVVPREADAALDGLDNRGRRQVAVTERIYGSALVVPLGMTTRVNVPHLVDALADLADTRAAVVELATWAPEPVVPLDADHIERREARAREAVASGSGARMGGHLVESRYERDARAFEGLSIFEDLATSVRSGVTNGVSIGASAMSSATHVVGEGVTSLMSRLEQRREQVDVRLADGGDDGLVIDGATALKPQALPDEHETDLPEAGDLRRRDTGWGSDEVDGDDSDWDVARTARARVEHAEGTATEEVEPEVPFVDEAIGSRVKEARERLGLTVESVAERTTIQRPVITGIEDDDFGPCGGDFYARAHLRSLATTLGLAGDDLVASYDAHHASAPVNASRVFEADRPSGKDEERSGRRWAAVVAIVLTLVLAWGLARLFAEQPQPITSPVLTSGAATGAGQGEITSVFGTPVPMTVTAARGPAEVTVKDHAGSVLFTGKLPSGGSKQVVGTGPFDVTADLPANVDVRVDGEERGAVGTGYTETSRSFD